MGLSRRALLLSFGLSSLLGAGRRRGTWARAEEVKREFMGDRNTNYDCVIVGGGAAGLSAALVLGRARRRVLVCDRGNPRNAPAHASHGFFTRDGTSPFELLEIGREQLRPYGTVELRPVGVRDINRSGDGFEVFFDGGAPMWSRKILLAFGVVDVFPEVENFGDFWGKSVFHCPYCHGFEVRDRPLAVVGNGEAGVGMAALLKNWSTDLVLCTDGRAELSEAQRRVLEKHKVPVREGRIVRLEGREGQLEDIVFETGVRLARRGMLIRPRQRLRSDLAERLGCELTDAGLIRIMDFNETTVKGVYAAGDVTSPMQSIAAAVAQGSAAGGAGINHALSREDFG